MVRAHLKWDEAQAMGISLEDWSGNQRADAAAGGEVAKWRLPPAVRRTRQELAVLAARAQKVLAAVQVAALRAAHKDGRQARGWRARVFGGAGAHRAPAQAGRGGQDAEGPGQRVAAMGGAVPVGLHKRALAGTRHALGMSSCG